MKKYVDYLIKSIFAGVMIGIAGTVFLRVDNNIIGSFLFSIGCYSGEPITAISQIKGGYVVLIKDVRYNFDADLAKAILICS